MRTTNSSTPVLRLISVVWTAVCLALAGCGSASSAARPAAERVCDGARQTAVRVLGNAVTARIVNRDPANLKCVLKGRRVRIAIVSQASSRAYTEFDTTTSHQDQVYGAGGVHQPGQIPVQVTVPGAVVAVWIPAERQIVATDATPTRGGTYIVVTVTGRSARGQHALTLAQALTGATLAAHPEAGS